MIADTLIELLRENAPLFNSPLHGLRHWRTVERNGLYLARFSGADPVVVSHFACFHDCMRVNEGSDPEHGPRGAAFAERYRDSLPLDDDRFDLLYRACSGHTFGRHCDDATIATCWDADRMDLGRVGIIPVSSYLLTREARRIADEGDYAALETQLDMQE